MNQSMTHHGIQGMKWGIRRTPEQLGRRQGKKDAKRIVKLNKSIRIKAASEKRSLEKAINTRMSNPEYRKSFKSTLKHLDDLAYRKKWTKDWNRGIANAVATTVANTYVRAMTGQFNRDIFAEMLEPSVRKMQSDALVKHVFGR